MNFYNPKTRKVVAVIIILVIAAMVGTMVIPYLMA